MNPDLERDGLIMTRVHHHDACSHRACVIHNPSQHAMRSARLHWREDRGIFERICAHGVGHPDFDQGDYWAESGQEWQNLHNCDGCCGSEVTVLGEPARWIEDGYAATADGRVWSYWRSLGPSSNNRAVVDVSRPQELSPRPNAKGYLRVDLGGRRGWYIHRAVWQAWRGPIEDGLQVRHLDGDPSNNSLANLALGTQADNESDKVRHGTRPAGESHANSKLTTEWVVQIRNAFRSGMRLDDIMSEFRPPVSRASVYDSAVGVTWKSVDATCPPVPSESGRKYRKRRAAS